jgi:hypothetical protein
MLLNVSAATEPAKGPLRVHPQNRRYFTDGSGRAVYLTGSHTWANFQERGVRGKTADFDYDEYLGFMQRFGHNFMRMWRWEHTQWMQFVPSDTPIRYEPMAYVRSGPGKALDGKPKFDLTRFHQAYFDRLRRRVVAAGKQGIYVSVMLFQGFSIEQKGTDGVDPDKGNAWNGHPYNMNNNINSVNGDLNGNGEGEETHTLANPAVTRLQEAYIRKVIDTLNDLDNVLYEISNESHGGSTAWQYHMINFVHDCEKDKPKQHPVGMTFQWGKNSKRGSNDNLFESPGDWICPAGKRFLNDPPAADGKKVVVVDTDHIQPWDSEPQWVWKNFLQGNHFILMDHYKDFRIGSPKKTDPKHNPARQAMGYTRKLAERTALASMVPHAELSTTKYCLADPGREYLIYRPNGQKKHFQVTLREGNYALEWINPSNNKTVAMQTFRCKSASHTFKAPFKGRAVLHLKKQ